MQKDLLILLFCILLQKLIKAGERGDASKCVSVCGCKVQGAKISYGRPFISAVCILFLLSFSFHYQGKKVVTFQDGQTCIRGCVDRNISSKITLWTTCNFKVPTHTGRTWSTKPPLSHRDLEGVHSAHIQEAKRFTQR